MMDVSIIVWPTISQSTVDPTRVLDESKKPVMTVDRGPGCHEQETSFEWTNEGRRAR